MTRRFFFARTGSFAIAQTALMQSFKSFNAFAQPPENPSDYKALICVFLHGGNDGNNMLIPLDSQALSLYTKARGSLALNPGLIRPLAGGKFGVHPSMPNVQNLYNSNNLAFIANMGNLLTPTTKAAYRAGSVPVPNSLFSHPDQTAEMQTALASAAGVSGWGGRIAEALDSSYNGVTPMCTSFDGPADFINGNSTVGLVSPSGNGNLFCSMGALCDARVHGTDQMLSLPEENPLVAADQQMISRSLDLNRKWASIIKQAPALGTPFTSGFAPAFKSVVQMIQMRQAFNANRQIFFVGLGGFDFHSGQLAAQAYQLAAVDAGLAALAQALQEIGMFNQVTTVTFSDFGRTLQENGSGSDHGWGNHQIVMGGAIQSAQIFGTFPTLDPGGPDDSGDNMGRWIPTTSVSQVGAALALWFGVPWSNLNTIFPNLSQFYPPQAAVTTEGRRNAPLSIFG